MNPTRLPEGIAEYIRYVNAIERLTRDEEREVAEKWSQKHDRASGDRLVCANLRHVVAIARGYQRYQVPLDELIGEGNLGLMQALKKFDPGRGNRFVTYAAYWIRAFILRHIAVSWSLVGGRGSIRTKMFFRLRKERAKLSVALGDEHEVMQRLAATLGASVERTRLISAGLEGGDVSMEMPLGAGSMVFGEVFKFEGVGPEEEFAHQEAQTVVGASLWDAVSKLDPRERFIVERRLMADSAERMSLQEVGHHFGVSRERIRQIEARAKGKLRQKLAGLEQIAA
jgi:RNA polymerase sigma-32 factor